MNLSILTMDGFLFVLKSFHVYFGIIWVGLLYYFNFVQGAFMAEADAATKSGVTQKLVPRALLWFRYAALATFLTGLAYLAIVGKQQGPEFLNSSYGIIITLGALFGTVMFLNVWLIIWPNQKVVIQNAVDVAAGKPANPAVAGCAARGLVASRTNTLFSVPMLFCMIGARHFAMPLSEPSNKMAFIGLMTVLIALIEVNAIKGKVGPLATVRGVIHMGFALLIVVYAAAEALL